MISRFISSSKITLFVLLALLSLTVSMGRSMAFDGADLGGAQPLLAFDGDDGAGGDDGDDGEGFDDGSDAPDLGEGSDTEDADTTYNPDQE